MCMVNVLRVVRICLVIWFMRQMSTINLVCRKSYVCCNIRNDTSDWIT